MRSFLTLLLPFAHANPKIQEVIKMLTDMKGQCKDEINSQEKSWMEFRQWCDDTHKSKTKEIKQLSVDLDEAEAGSSARVSTILEADEAFKTAQTKAATAADDLSAMQKQRDAANGQFKEKKNELESSIAACEQAVDVLSQVPSNSPAASHHSLLQSGVLNSIRGKKGSSFTAIRELLQMAAPPQAKKYAIQKSSGSILQMINDLRASFEDELGETNDRERADSEAHLLEKQATDDTKAIAEKLAEAKEAEKATAETEKARFDEDVSTFKASLDKATTYSRDLNSECSVKAKDFIREAKSRQEELVAIDEAVKIIAGASVSAAGKVISPPAAGEGESFIQLTGSDMSNDNRRQVYAMLKKRGRELGSNSLVQIATAIMADPFGKIKKLIGDLITRLSNERMSAIASQNNCQVLLEESVRKIEKATGEVDKTSTEKTELEAQIAQKEKQLDETSEAIQDDQNSSAELAQQRADESATNAKSLKELVEGADAVAAAVQVLQDYYSTASGGESLIQEPLNADFAPSKAYGGNDASVSILSLLSEIEADMRKSHAETQASEKTSADNAVEAQRQLTVNIAGNKSRMNGLTSSLAGMQSDLVDAKNSLETATDLLNKETKFKRENLDAKCTETGVSFEERAAKRKEEIESLQDALKILQQVMA